MSSAKQQREDREEVEGKVEFAGIPSRIGILVQVSTSRVLRAFFFQLSM